MNKLRVQSIPAFTDNYIWSIENGTSAVIVDPGHAEPVIQHLQDNNLQLNAILVTHHHGDHVGGIKRLKEVYPSATIIGFRNATYAGIEEPYEGNDTFQLLDIEFSLIEVPGHTLDHVAYFAHFDQSPVLFCGDTLFSGGCGRLFEGSAEQMYTSLCKVKGLPGNTQIYCAHEYTLANLEFARTLNPTNQDLLDYQALCASKRSNNESTIPTTLQTEIKVNPFLRETDPEIIDNLRKLGYTELNDSIDCFAAIRKAKDLA